MGTDTEGTGLPWVEAIAASFPPYEFEAFHTTALPTLVDRHGALVVGDLAGVTALAFRLHDGPAVTWRPTPAGVEAVPGDADAATVVDLDEATFSEVLHGLLTAVGAVRTERAHLTRGRLAEWQRWEPAIQTLLTGDPVYSPAIWDSLVDRDGAPLDLHRSFGADEDRDEMRHFLATAGYLHVQGVYTTAEATSLGDEVEAVRAATTPGDPFSWWSVDAAGDEVVTRINYLGRHSDVLQQHCFDDRLTAVAALAGEDLRVCDDRLDGPMVFIKHSDVVKGNSDLGWHTDDGLGGHPVMCPLLQAGVQLDAATPANGQLMVLAGSHRRTTHWPAWGGEAGLPLVRIETRPGDVTLHFGDTLHSTPPPTAPGAGRRALYYKFAEPKTFAWVPSGCHYNDALFHVEADTGRVATRATTY